MKLLMKKTLFFNYFVMAALGAVLVPVTDEKNIPSEEGMKKVDETDKAAKEGGAGE